MVNNNFTISRNINTMYFFQKTLQRILIVIIGVLMVFIVLSFSGSPSFQRDISTKEAINKPASPSIDIKLAEAKPFQGYAETIRSRDIFKQPYRGRTRPASGQRAQEGAVISSNAPLADKFKLVGIIIDATPQAVIEDIDKKETLFLNVGDVVDGMELVHVEEGKIVVAYNGKKFEMKAQ